MELPPIGSGATEIFHLDLPLGRPAASSLLYSLCVHASLIAALLTVSLPQTTHAEIPVEPLQPTELRLDGHLYYVAKIPASAGEGRKQQSNPAPATKPALPQAADSGRTPAPAIELPKLPQIVVKSTAPRLPDADAEISATRKLVRRELARTFVPPEVKRDPAATQTLIQALSPPDLIPKPTPLPSFRISSPQFPNIPKPFVAPGRKTPAPPAQVPEVAAPNIPLAATPVFTTIRPKLPQPVAAPPPEPATVAGPPPAPQGDPVSILSLSDHPVPMDKNVVVPAGNIAQESGEAQAAQAGSAVAASSAGSNTGKQNSPAPSNANIASTASARAAKSSAQTAAIPAASGSASSTPSRATTIATNAAAPVLTLIPPVADSDSGSGQGSVGSGTGAALAGASATGDTSAVAGSTKLSSNGSASAAGNAGKIDAGKGAGSGSGTGTGTGSGKGRAAAGQVINKPQGGTYDAVVIQSSPVDQYPETRGLLSGRPIYSVYISAGTAKDWTLYFCIPNAKPPETSGPVVTIGAPETPVRAPYAYKLVRPDVKLPSYERYVLLHGFVSAEGRFQNIHIVRTILPEVDAAILAAMADWEFRAATKDGVPIQVEFLLSIPAKGL